MCHIQPPLSYIAEGVLSRHKLRLPADKEHGRLAGAELVLGGPHDMSPHLLQSSNSLGDDGSRRYTVERNIVLFCQQRQFYT